MSDIENILHEDRSFPPSAEFASQARIGDIETYRRMYAESIADPEAFFGRVARELPWIEPFTEVLDWSNAPFARWFGGGTLNASAVCLDQHVEAGRGERVAIRWEGEPGDTREFTYAELHAEVQRFANVLLDRGVKKGDRVAIYMPMVPELAMACLACARIGAIHSVVFGGFSANALRERIEDGGCTAVITADGGWRRGKVLPLKPAVDEAVEGIDAVHTVLVVRRTENDVAWNPRDVWYHEAVKSAAAVCAPEPMDSEDTLFILYTSGSTGRPKGIQHTTAGYLLHTYLTTKYVFDVRDDDVFWCTADVGWITGHSYIVYGPLANGCTQVMYEGAPNAPHTGRFWELVQKYGVTIFYTAPTAIRTFMRWGDDVPAGYDLSSLRLLGTVGEPINPEAWMWYREHIGGDRCPIVDTWWQTETGGHMLTPLPGCIPTKPGSCTVPFFGVDAAIVDENGVELPANHGGLLVIRKPWPSMLRGLWGDPERYRETYWSKFGSMYFAGDGARRDVDGYFWIMGRVDDVLNVSGHRLSTMEVESALVAHPAVVEAAVVARPDEVTGEAVVAFVTPVANIEVGDELAQVLREYVAKEIGAIAKPADIRFTEALPKTRSGKIMRRLLRDVAAGRESTGDTSTIEDLSVLAKLRGEN
ncbi:Acetyl-coenzyme A ligase [Planctomycetes bacterium Pla163]|uniref:Acetyl-coenzyme A synthetase n=1 Tax=Rohdeia mirabilis TaxID=2528008 RepID=A0A518D065_9BACT|nr:Acetyl-coenzyme A ligase [Planctomycetes bacterium Pla163]